MKEFFNLNPSNNVYNITFAEKFIPIFITAIIIIFLIFKKDKLEKFDNLVRYTLIFISSIPLALYYIILWLQDGIQVYNLPLHLCFFSNILAIILCFNKSKRLFDILIFAGVLGGASSLIAPSLDLSWNYFRYYQFMICHISIIIIPLYFLFVYNYKVDLKEFLSVFLIIELIGLSLGIFNELFKTNYMFISFSSNFASYGSILNKLGNKFYFFKIQFLYLIIMILWFLTLKFIFYIKRGGVLYKQY